ncbi:hypothetical protein E2C01_005962 [Portunus trituberculatus]|uniref:Uncharacterized protein n=1 Tax=Portunus trituberculatus TaxID=210409 RepID=A0A5B7CTR2_PORTR|nr:hypothetical protein [Portunus trituberculatus]
MLIKVIQEEKDRGTGGGGGGVRGKRGGDDEKAKRGEAANQDSLISGCSRPADQPHSHQEGLDSSSLAARDRC